MSNKSDDLSSFSMMDLFKSEVENHSKTLIDGLLRLESGSDVEKDEINALMRAAHSIKGAARVVKIDVGVEIAHTLEDCFVAAQEGKITLKPEHVDLFFKGIDLLKEISQLTENEIEEWSVKNRKSIDDLLKELGEIKEGKKAQKEVVEKKKIEELPTLKTKAEIEKARTLRIATANLDRLMALAEETIVETKSLNRVIGILLATKKRQIRQLLLIEKASEENPTSSFRQFLDQCYSEGNEINRSLAYLLDTFEGFSRRSDQLSERLHAEIITNRMRSFSDGLEGFSRMVRDIARSLGKKAKLNVIGGNTLVDMDILDKLNPPLNHILRNAVDHGIETPEERKKLGKNEEGTITLEAAHKGGMLKVIVSDDGQGMDVNFLKKKLVEKEIVSPTMVDKLSEEELMEFIFLPAFSSKKTVTEYSGRGVGLDVVYDMVQEVKGSVQTTSQVGTGTSFHLSLPLTLSVTNAIVAEVGGEFYGFPLERVDQVLTVEKEDLKLVNGKYYFPLKEADVGIAFASEIFYGEKNENKDLPIIVISDRLSSYGVVVDRFVGEKKLVLNKLDQRLGEIPNISSASMMADGEPILVVDIGDLVRFVDSGFLERHKKKQEEAKEQKPLRILLVDDSETVRKEATALLESEGYEVEIAVDGKDGWNALRLFEYDLLITDIDMPRMSGFELMSLVQKDSKLKIPIIVVSYKKGKEDQEKAKELGAKYCLTKASFQDGSFVKSIAKLLKKGKK